MGKGGGRAHTPVEVKDNLKSTQMMSVIDAIGEGPIEGPVKGLQSILVNKTPLTDTDGNPVIHGVTAVWRAGEQEQTPPEGFESSGAETALGVEVTKVKPVTRTITSANIDRLRVTFGVQSLLETTSKGDRNPSSVRLLIQLQRNGNWVTEKDVTINGKTTSQYLASVILENLPERPFNIRMVRETADNTSDQLQNKTLWSSYTEIIDVKQCYPNTAIVGLQVDAEQFGGQQMTVNYHIRGRIIQVPSNYDPEKRTYSGIWDGSLKPAYSNNPAWCLWDMLTHPRYGMGKRLGAADVDKWALYAIAQYCDQTVPDGFGGTEPRMTFNAYLSQQRKAWDVLSDFCSAMRCMPVWNGQTLTFVQDRPSDVVWPYTNCDVVVDDNGVGFRYSFSALKDRHTAVEVNYTDPQNGWQTSTELVEDPEAILRYGRNLLKMDAFGCTSRGQAHRAGLWVIKTGLLETQTVDFTLGSQGLRHTPGDIIEICDNDYAGTMTGGRVLSIDAASRTLTLDREVTLPETGAATVNLINGSGKPVSVAITAHPAPDRIQVSTLPDGVETYGVWGLSLPSLRRRLFRCVSIRENTDGTFAITAVQHVPEKEAIVDNGASFEPQSGTLNSVIPPAVQHLTVEQLARQVEPEYTPARKAHLYHCDHRGLPLALISEDGNTAWSAEYDEWGNQLNEENPHHVYQPYRLPGQQHDEESGLYYNRHRYYDPLQGRYITQDPMGLKGGWNLYQYPLNPLQQIDPMGLLQTWDDARSGACTGGVCGVLSRIIGPSKFDSTADAALDALKETQNRSLCNDMEYSGIVCKDTNGKYFASKAETDNLRKESYPLKRKCPTGTDRVAAYHTHGADSHGDYVDEFFSSSDKNLVRSKDNNLEAFYLATPDGRFEALNNKGEYIFIRNSVPGLSSVCIPYHD